MRPIRLLLFTLFMTATSFAAFAQQTGTFNATVPFMGQNRTLSCVVPSNYDPAINYRVIIGLHGLGDNSANYRSALMNSLGWSSIFDTTIFIFPDGGDDANSDFHMPLGDEDIIAECINFVKQNYTIDSTDIILQGFSLGGRSALQYGLEHADWFKGLLLNTPAMQGVLDAENVPGVSLGNDFSKASDVPIYMTIGATDFTYTSAVDILHSILKKNDAKVAFRSVSGLGHSIPNNGIISPCIPFFEDPALMDFDIEVFEIEMPERTCDPTVDAHIWLRNLGSQPVTDLEIDYTVAGNTFTYTWNGNLGLYKHARIKLPAISASGKQVLDVNLGAVNVNMADPTTNNNQMTRNFEIDALSKNLPVFEGFEANEDDWIFEDNGSLFLWSKDQNVSRTGQGSMFAFNTILIFNTLGAEETFVSPIMDFTSVNKPTLAFDVAFNFHRYTPPYFTDTVDFADTLQVLISTDCGQTYQSIYKKGGADLATADAPIYNPLNVADCFFDPIDSTDWRKERIDLSQFSTATEVLVKFSYISSLGGSINVDNITFDDASVISNPEEKELVRFEMYPNPAQDLLHLSYDAEKINKVTIIDLNGRVVLVKELNENNSLELDVSSFDRGLYLVKANGAGYSSIQKLLIR